MYNKDYWDAVQCQSGAGIVEKKTKYAGLCQSRAGITVEAKKYKKKTKSPSRKHSIKKTSPIATKALNHIPTDAPNHLLAHEPIDTSINVMVRPWKAGNYLRNR